MNIFEVKNINDAPTVPCTHEDLGLCYVSKFNIGLVEFYSIVPKAENPNNYATIRIEEAKKTLLQHGYSWNGVF